MHMCRRVGAAVGRGLVFGPASADDRLGGHSHGECSNIRRHLRSPRMARRSCCKITRVFPCRPCDDRHISAADQLPRSAGTRELLALRADECPTSGPLVFSSTTLTRNNLSVLAKATRRSRPISISRWSFQTFDSYPGYAGGLVTFVSIRTMPLTASSTPFIPQKIPPGWFGAPDHHQFAGLDLSGGYTTTAAAASACWHDRPGGGSRRMDGHQREQRRVRRYGARDSAGRIRQQHSPDRQLAVQSPGRLPSKATTAISTSRWAMESPGETAGATHATPQRLDNAIQGKIHESLRTSTGIRWIPSVRTVVIASPHPVRTPTRLYPSAEPCVRKSMRTASATRIG